MDAIALKISIWMNNLFYFVGADSCISFPTVDEGYAIMIATPLVLVISSYIRSNINS